MAVISDVITMVGDVMTGILTKEPMNYYIGGGLISMALGLFARGKQAAG